MSNMELWKGNFLLWMSEDQAEFPYYQDCRKCSLLPALQVYSSAQAVCCLEDDKDRKRNNLVSIGSWGYELVLAVDSAVYLTSRYKLLWCVMTEGMTKCLGILTTRHFLLL